MPICLFAAVFATTTKIGDLGRPLRDEAAEGGCRSAGDSGAVLSDAQGGVFCRSGRDEGEGLALSLKNLVSKPALMFESAVVPVMLRCAKIADRLAAAAVARGIDRPGRKTSLQRAPVRMGRFPASLDRLPPAACFVVAKANQGIGGLL